MRKRYWKPLCMFYNKRWCKGKWDNENLCSDRAAYFAMYRKDAPSHLVNTAYSECGKNCKYYRSWIYCPYLSH